MYCETTVGEARAIRRLRGRDCKWLFRQDIVRGSLEVLDENIPIAVFIEYACVDQFEFIVLAGRACDFPLPAALYG